MSEPTGASEYPQVPAQPRYPSVEEEILAFWREDRTFEASVAMHGPETEYVFYDGPPFANGLPHYGHLLTGFVKDAVPRFRTMRGQRVERRFGWDCHGLPAEMAAEQELGLSGRQAVIASGIGDFNAYCRRLVQRTTDAWERYVTRQARWVDFEDDYRTMDLSYMESVIWAFKRLHDKGLTYEGFRVLPYCWECETPLSNFETRQDDSYRDRTDPAVTVRFDLEPTDEGPELLRGALGLLAWTTTPWTLPSNLALAVGPELVYSVLALGGRRVVVGEACLEAYSETLAGAEVLGTVRGADLVGRRFLPLFDYFAATPGAFVVLGEDFVALDEGTGIVQMAPGFGEDDQRACEAAGIAVICPVDDRACFTGEVADLAGVQVFEANALIVQKLKSAGALVRAEEYTHSYPHCWRTDTPLIYRAMSSWFVAVTAFKDRMVELNQQITWVPEHVRDGAFGKWLEGARDWSISRNRFWGTPIPVWKSDDPAYPRVDVYGSLDELEADFKVRPDDLHRPAIDELTRPNPDDPTGSSVMRRIPDVLDCWFDSGSMPFAQLHYPFEHAKRFEQHFPADFIVEYVGQTRGWFYTLHVLATALFDRPPFKTCIAHGIVLGDDGRKLSKRLRNFPDPEEVFAAYGADAMRWYLLSSPVLRGLDVVIEEKGLAEPLRLVCNPIWNSWYFLSLYANADGLSGRVRTDQAGVLDRYILAKTRRLVEDATASMDLYDLAGACGYISAFLDALTNWYVRRSRDRFWRPVGAGGIPGEIAGASAPDDKQDAYDTLHTVLEVLTRVAAPFLPFLCEAVYRGLTGERSVHLRPWPAAEELPADPELVDAMDLAREVCSAGHSIRKAAGRRARLPLLSLTVASPGASRLLPYADLIADEVNVRQVKLLDTVGELAEKVLNVIPAALGPRLGPRTQQVIAAARKGDWSRLSDGTLQVGGIGLLPGEFDLRLRPSLPESCRSLPGEVGIVALDLETTPELEAEGTARDVIRLVQRARRDAGLQVTDRIRLWIGVPAASVPVISQWARHIAAQVLAVEIEIEPYEGGDEGAAKDDEAFTAVGELSDRSVIVIRIKRS
ncbi:MAG: isoleucine--tRNA ligase [Acidimicrobiales bacterium]